MPMLSGGGGGGKWFPLKNLGAGDVLEGSFVSYETDVPSNNPRYGPQDVLTLEVDGQVTKIGANAAVKNIMRANTIAPGSLLRLIGHGQTRNPKSGFTFNKVEIELVEDTSFPAGAPKPVGGMNGTDDELARKLAEARARRSA